MDHGWVAPPLLRVPHLSPVRVPHPRRVFVFAPRHGKRLRHYIDEHQ